MQKIIYLIFLTLVISSQLAYAQYDFNEPKNGIKYIKETTYSLDGTENQTMIEIYDKKGRLVSQKSINSENKGHGIDFSYQKKNIAIEKHYEIENEVRTELKQVEKKLLNNKKNPRIGMNIKSFTNYADYEDGMWITETISIKFDSTILKVSSALNEPKSFDKIIIEKRYDETPGINMKFVYSWDSTANLYPLVTVIASIPTEDGLTRKTKYSYSYELAPDKLFADQCAVYNNKGDMVKTENVHLDMPVSDQVFKYTKFDQRGNWVEMETYTGKRIIEKTTREIGYK